MTDVRNKSTIDHPGTVRSLGNNSVSVTISADSACSACHARGACGLSGSEEKVIEVTGRYNVKPGDNVIVEMKLSMGYRALLLGYILPVLLVIVVLIILATAHLPELTAGIISLTVLIPYYLLLYLFRKKISREFSFTIKDL